MEVTALCTGLSVLVLQSACCADRMGGALLRVVPNRLQFFEFDSVSFDCDGFDDFTEWRVMKRIMGDTSPCVHGRETSRKACSLQHVLEGDSGDYWCEANGSAISSSVHITVTDGSVILESPAVPVLEGTDVTLLCRNKTSSVHVADFYQDGTLKQTGYKGNIHIHNVSKSDEGLYKCDISGVESAASWLVVRASPTLHEEGQPSSKIIMVWVTATCSMTLLLLGLSLCGKRTVSGQSGVLHPQRPISYAATEPGVSTVTTFPAVDASSQHASDAVYYTLG